MREVTFLNARVTLCEIVFRLCKDFTGIKFYSAPAQTERKVLIALKNISIKLGAKSFASKQK